MYLLPEDASVKSARAIHRGIVTELKSAVDSSESMALSFATVKRIDLAVAQVIVAAVRKARAEGISVRVLSACDAVRKQLGICGLKI